MKKILVTGSSGYIGQHLVKMLQRSGYDVYGLDKHTLYNDYLMPNHFVNYDILNNISIYSYSYYNHFDTVVHLAALVQVGESVEIPTHYYETNINGTINVLNDISYDNFIFASTGAAENPISPYGLSKRCAEDIVKECAVKSDKTYTIFRFYNVIGADGVNPSNPDGLFYNLIRAKDTGKFTLYGNDYNTPDGTAIRDYVHVNEICNAIKLAIECPANSLQNLGHGKGNSVQTIVDTFKYVNECEFEVVYGPRRTGDLEKSVLDNPSEYMKSLYTLSELLRLK